MPLINFDKKTKEYNLFLEFYNKFYNKRRSFFHENYSGRLDRERQREIKCISERVR